MARAIDRDDDEDLGFGPESGRGRFSGRYTREQDEKTGGRQLKRRGRRDHDNRGRAGGSGVRDRE